MTARHSPFLAIAVLISVLLIGVVFGAYYLGTKKSPVKTPQPQATITPSATIKPSPTTTESLTPTATESLTKVPTGWETYPNDKYNFEISFPKPYRALTDKNNLYGWPNGVALIYKGGQSYDIAIEVWNSKTEYESKYQSQMQYLTVYPVGNKYLTLTDLTHDPQNAQIIATFKLGD